jgi:hypothetical protein
LGYIIGKENLDKTIKKYYSDYKFTHPTPNDIKRTAEKISGANLDWYLNEWTQTINTIDYAIKSVEKNTIILERKGRMPMPIDVIVEFENGTKEYFYIPNTLMRWEKPNPYKLKGNILIGWDWATPRYTFETNTENGAVKSVIIDPTDLMADVKKDDNIFPKK